MESTRDNKAVELQKHHSIESALIQASSKGYTIEMILGNHEKSKATSQPAKKENYGYSADEEHVENGT